MKNLLILFFIGISCTVSKGQNFVKTFTNPEGATEASQALPTNDGGFLIVGRYTIPGPFYPRSFIVKTDRMGNITWTTNLEGGPRKVRQTSDGGYIFTGDGDGISESFYIKIDNNGNVVWHKLMPAPNPMSLSYYAWDILETSDPGYTIFGRTQGGNPRGNFLVKINEQGDAISTKIIDPEHRIFPEEFHQTYDNGFIAIGTHLGLPVASDRGTYLMRLNENGDIIWKKKYTIDLFESTRICSDNGFLLYGRNSLKHAYLVRFNSSGDSIASYFYNSIPLMPTGAIQTNDGGYVLIGHTEPEQISTPVSSYLIKFDANGVFVSEKAFTDATKDIKLKSIETLSDGGFILSANDDDDLLLMRTDALGESLPIPPWKIVSGGLENHVVIVPNNVSFDNAAETLELGDYLGIFFKDENGVIQLSDTTKWTGANTSLTASGSSSSSPKNGFAASEEFILKIWKANSGAEFCINATYIMQPPFTHAGDYSNNGFSRIASFSMAPTCETFIPDANFRQCLKETYPNIFDANDNIILEEAKKIQEIHCSNKNIKSISGIEAFINVNVLNFDTNLLTKIPELASLHKLTTLYFGQNRLSSLPDLSVNPDLEFISFYANNFSTFPDISNNGKISFVEFQINNLQSVPDLSHLKDLSFLSVAFNPLETMPSLEENAELTLLNIQATSLTIFPEVSKNLKLTSLVFGKNPQFSTWPEITLNVNLQYIHCDGNGLTSLPDLRIYPKLLALVCSQNKLRTLPDLSNFPSLNHLDCRDNFLTSLPDLSRTQLGLYFSQLFISGNHLTFEDLIPVIPSKTYVVLEYGNQTLPLIDSGITKRTGDSFTLATEIDKNVTDNLYKWYRDNDLIATTNSNSFYVDSLSMADAGVYHCEITNSNIRDLNIVWRQLRLEVRPDTVIVCQNINLKKGWNLISSYVSPNEPALTKIFKGMTDVIVKKASGTILYASSFGITDGTWDTSEGYMVYSSTNQQLNICGRRINPRTPITLVKYSYPVFLPYYGDVEMPVKTVLAGLSANYNFAQSIEYLNGVTLPSAYNYIPSHIIDPAIDQIGKMKPGLAYKISLQNNISGFRFPETIRSGRTNGGAFESISPTQHFTVSTAGNGANAVVVIPDHVLRDKINYGDEIAIVDKTGNVLGAIVYEDMSMAITTWENSEHIHDTAFGVKVWRKQTGQEFTVELTYSMGSGVFVANTLSIADNAIFLEDGQNFTGAYPNPANDLVSFSFDVAREQNVRIILLNALGNEIIELTNKTFAKGKHTAAFDVSKLYSGQYVYRIITAEKVVNNKLIIIKN